MNDIDYDRLSSACSAADQKLSESIRVCCASLRTGTDKETELIVKTLSDIQHAVRLARRMIRGLRKTGDI